MHSIARLYLLAMLLLLTAASSASLLPQEPVDLAGLPEGVNLVDVMQVREAKALHEGDRQPERFSELLSAEGWKRGEAAQQLVIAPRERSAIWLHAPITNTSNELLDRWLDISPWRLNRVQAWYLNPDTLVPMSEAVTGLDIPVTQRSIESNRALLPVKLNPGETQQLLIKVFSESRPFLNIHSWSPVEYTEKKALRYQSHTFFLSVVLTLVLVVLLQRTRLYLLMAAWMLATFVFEAEKEGYISYVLIDGLAPYAVNMRFSFWIFSEALFLIASVYLLRIRRLRPFSWFPAIALGVSAVFSIQTFFLDGTDVRVLGSLIHLCFSIAWLCMLPSAFKKQYKWKFSMLALLSVWWGCSNFLLVGYFFNFYYTAEFSSIKVLSAAVSILGLLYIYSIQKKQRENDLRERLVRQEKQQRKFLEKEVLSRTQELRQAVANADQANTAKSEFLARVSHDLKSPLTSILGYSQLLFSEKGRAGEMSRTIYSSASHLLNMVDRLIGYARGSGAGEVKFKDMYLHAFLNKIVNEARFVVKENDNAFEVRKFGEVPSVICTDEGLLRQILLNLLDNSAKHTREGKITLDVRVEPVESQDR